MGWEFPVVFYFQSDRYAGRLGFDHDRFSVRCKMVSPT